MLFINKSSINKLFINKKKLYISAAAVAMLFAMTGCDKEKSKYEVSAVFAYTDIQETKESPEMETATDTDAIMPPVADASQTPTDNPSPTDGPAPQTRQNPNAANSAQTPNAPATGDQTTSGEGASSEGNSPGGGGATGGENGDGGDQNGGDSGNTKTPEEPKKTEKSYGLEYEGDLGRYIWGEKADTSDLHIYYTAEGGRKEIKDYEISMDYPELRATDTISTGDNHRLVYDTYDPGSRVAMVTYGKYYCQVPYELDIVYVTFDINITNYCTDPAHRNDITYDDEGFATEKYSADGLWNDTDDMSAAFPGYTYCKYCSAISSNTQVETIQYDEVIDGMKYIRYKDVDMTTYGCRIGKWTVYYPLYEDYTFTRDEFDKIGIVQDYTTVADYKYDSLVVDKNSMLGFEWAGDYVFDAGCYVKFNVVAPEGTDLSWIP